MTKRAQTTLEACLLIILVALAWLAMQGFFQRSIQGNWRASIDAFSDEQYEQGTSNETVSPIIFEGSNINAFATNAQSTLGTFAVASMNDQTVRVSGWGTF